jgi:hypothetical protein
MEARYHGWAFFFAACFAVVAAYLFHLAALPSHKTDRVAVVALGLVALLGGARFAVAGFTGRFPRWMITFIDIR